MLITLSQAATRLGLSSSTLREQITRGRLEAIKPGNEYLVEEIEVERYRQQSLAQAGRPSRLDALEAAIQQIRVNGFMGGAAVMPEINRVRVLVDELALNGRTAAVRAAARSVQDRVNEIMTGPDQAKNNWEALWRAFQALREAAEAGR